MKCIGLVNRDGHVYDYMPMSNPLDAWHWHKTESIKANDMKGSEEK